MRSNTITQELIKNWVNLIQFRQVNYSDLRSLEWEGTYIHFRKVYLQAYQRTQEGKALMRVAELPQFGIVGQVFIQLISSRRDLADGIDKAYLYAFRVRPQFRNHGLGKKMLFYAETLLIKRGYSEIILNVAKKNINAIRLYENYGYQIVGNESGDWTFRDHNNETRRIVEPAWKMSKRITNHPNLD